VRRKALLDWDRLYVDLLVGRKGRLLRGFLSSLESFFVSATRASVSAPYHGLRGGKFLQRIQDGGVVLLANAIWHKFKVCSRPWAKTRPKKRKQK
jgi:hypothetical protein